MKKMNDIVTAAAHSLPSDSAFAGEIVCSPLACHWMADHGSGQVAAAVALQVPCDPLPQPRLGQGA